MDIKGGSSAAIRGGSGENADFLNAPENLTGAVENVEAAFNSEPMQFSEASGEPVETSEAAPVEAELSGEPKAAEAAPAPKGEASPAEADIVEFGQLLEAHSRQNEDDVDKRIAREFYADTKKYEDDPFEQAKVVFGDGWKYKKAVFPQTWANGEGEAAA